MTSRTSRLSQDQNLGVNIDGKASFRGQKKTGKAAVRKPIGEASFKGKKKTRRASVRKPIGEASSRGQRKTGKAAVSKPIGDSPNSGKKPQDGPLISGKQVKSKKLASVKEEAVPSKDKNLDSKRTASKVPIVSEIRRLGRVNFVRAYPEFINIFFLETRPAIDNSEDKVVFEELEPERSDLEDWDEKFDLESD